MEPGKPDFNYLPFKVHNGVVYLAGQLAKDSGTSAPRDTKSIAKAMESAFKDVRIITKATASKLRTARILLKTIVSPHT